MSLPRLKWIAIVAPVTFLVVVGYLVRGPFHEQLHEFPGYLYALGVLTTAVSAFSFFVFGVIDRVERHVLEQNAHLSVLNEIAAAAARNLELEQLLNVALDKVLEVTKADAGVICLVDDETEELVAARHLGISDELARRISKTLTVEPAGADDASVARPAVFDDLLAYPQLATLAGSEGVRSAIGLPLRSEDQVHGVLAVISRRERRFAPKEIELLASVARQLGLATRNAVLFANVQQRRDELEALLTVGQAASASLHVNDVLDAALEAILSVTTAEAAEVWLATGEQLELVRHSGVAAEAFRERTVLRLGEGLPGLAAERMAPVVVHDLTADQRCLRSAIKQLGFESFCAIPLVRGGALLGVLAVAARDRDALSGRAERRLLEAIGEQVAIAVENAHLHERVLDGAVIEERERLARELHDGLAQVLGYVNTQTLAIKKLLATGRGVEAERQVAEMESAARRVYTDVREAILGLRTTRGGLLPSLRAYLADYRRMSGLELKLEVDEEMEALRLPASVEIQVVRIVQEALSNVRKHAHARAATVRIRGDAGTVEVEVDDDGQGFEFDRPRRTGWPHFGLQTMRERAEAIGGTFAIESSPSAGTSVIVRVPLNSVPEVSDANRAR